MIKKILVTGGTGYIGSHTIVDLLAKGYNVVSVDNGVNSDVTVLDRIEEISGRSVVHYQGDLCDLTVIGRIFNDHPDIAGVIHFAALKAVGESVDKPLLYFQNNITSLLNVLTVCEKYDVRSLVFSSSCTVYGDVTNSPVNEETPWQEAASPYGRTKQIGEQIITDCLLNRGNLKASLLRYFNPAGAHPSGLLGESPRNIAQNLVPAIAETAIGKREKLTVYGTDYQTRDGSCVRDYIHVCDLADAHTRALEYIFDGRQDKNVETFNLGIGAGLTVLEIINAFQKVTGVSLNYTLGERRSGDVGAIYCNNTKACKLLGWKPKYTAEDIMRTAWAWEKVKN
jgi:UDP-glucose 4-epimerase